jgi:hypothetical protein
VTGVADGSEPSQTDDTPTGSEPHPALTTLPTDDVGAETQDRFTWQHHCIAGDCIVSLADHSSARIICEMHEDYVIEANATLQLVGCKHREPGRGPWSLQELCSDGGLAHLFSRWTQFPTCSTKLMTNADLRRGAEEARHVIDTACSESPDEDSVTKLGRALLLANTKGRHAAIPTVVVARGKKVRSQLEVPDAFLQQVRAFAKSLSVVHDLPSRHHIRSHHIQELAQPYMLRSCGVDAGAAEAYDRLVELVAGKNRIDPLKSDYSSWFGGNVRGSALAMVTARSLFPADVAGSFVPKIEQLPLESWPGADHSRLRIKLLQGGLKSTRINSALILREAWLAAWARQRLGLPGDQALRHDLEARVLHIAGDAESATCAEDGTPWGNRMYDYLWSTISQQCDELRGSLPLRREHLMGLALDLAEQCQVWFSDEFEVDAFLAHYRHGEGVA